MGDRATANLCDGGNADHWHFVVRPETSDQVSEFFRRLTVMHTMRWHAHYKTFVTVSVGALRSASRTLFALSGESKR